MVWSEEVGPARFASGMPVKIVQGAQYMNDAMGSVYGKLTQAVNYQKSSEFRGGIWDCNPVKETVPSELSYIDTSNNLANKIYSLEEILACDDDVPCDDAEMQDDDLIRSESQAADDLVGSQSEEAEFSAPASRTDVCVDINNKRWRSEEFDKIYLLPSSDSETTRKKPKKNVSFSDTVVDLEDLSVSKVSKFVPIDVYGVKDDEIGLKETVIVKETKKPTNAAILTPENVNDAPVIIEDKGSVPERKSAVKKSLKVKNWTKLMEQSCEINHCDLEMPLEVGLSKTTSRERRRSRKSKSNKNVAEHETVTKLIADKDKLKNEELMNRSQLESAIPELFDLCEFNTKVEIDHKSMKKNMKEEVKCVSGELTYKQNLALELKSSQSSKNNSLVEGTGSPIELGNEVKSKEMEKNGERLKNSLLEIFDPDIAESLTFQLMNLAEQNKLLTKSDDKKMISMVSEKLPQENLEKQSSTITNIEDESQYKYENLVVPPFEENLHIPPPVCCPPICDKPSCSQQNFEKVRKDSKEDAAIEANTTRNDNKYGELSPTLRQSRKNSGHMVSYSRSDSSSNWRSQCIDVRLKDEKEDSTPQNSAVANWRSEYSNPRNLTNDASRHYNHKTRREENFKKQQAKKFEVPLEPEYEEDNIVVVPVYLKAPPEPMSRFKGIRADPESIWDERKEPTRPPRFTNQIQPKIDYFDWKNGSEAEEVHAQVEKSKTTSVPRFFDNLTRKSVQPHVEDVKHSSSRRIDASSPGMLNENYRSRSQSRQGNFTPYRSYERNRSASAHWRSPLSATSLEDVFYVVKIASSQDGKAEFKILKESFLYEMRENKELSYVVPPHGYKLRVNYSASAVQLFVRCIFSLSYKIPDWITALEAFVLAKKCEVDDLMRECEAYFINNEIQPDEIRDVAVCAQQLQAVDALKSSKFFQAVQHFKSFSDQNVYTPQSCTVSCSVFVDPAEFVIPLILEVNRSMGSCNESDVRNKVFFTSLARVTHITGIQLRFLAEDTHEQLKIICEVFQTKKGNSADKLFYQEFNPKPKSAIKISFEDEIAVKLSDEIEIVVYIEDVLFKICPQLTDNEFVEPGKFRAKFESSKTSKKNRKLFCIEKIFYTSQK